MSVLWIKKWQNTGKKIKSHSASELLKRMWYSASPLKINLLRSRGLCAKQTAKHIIIG